MSVREFPADTAELQSVTDYVEDELSKYNCPLKTSMQFALCLEEIFVNIAKYAYPKKPGYVHISVECDGSCYIVTLEDDGQQFNPLERMDPDITLPAEERDIGGLGIYIVKKTMDEVSYDYRGRNIFCMKKRV